MNNQIYLERIEKVKKEMDKNGVDVFFVSPSSNLFYLTGYNAGADERLLLLVLPKEGGSFLIANLLYKEQTKDLPIGDQVYWKDGEDPFKILKNTIAEKKIKIKTAALDPQITFLFTLPLYEILKNVKFSLGSSLTEPLRKFKDKSELELIREACRKSDKALEALIEKGNYWLGKTELDFLRELSQEMEKGGITSFGGSVQTGPNAAIPHYVTGNKIIESGNCLLIDFWGRYQGYFTDCTRTFHFGSPGSEFKKVYDIVLEAHLASEAKARTGSTLEDVDLAARNVISKNGYGDFFTHRTGHGLGIDVHEGDSVNTGVKTIIKPGMVFSIEPGIYIPGKFGVRIENCAAVNESGAEALHNYPRELKIII